MNVTTAWELVLSTMADSLTQRMHRSRQLNEAIRSFGEATDAEGVEDKKKMQAVLSDNLDRMCHLVEAVGMVARGLDGLEDRVDTSSEVAKKHLATILEMHPDGARAYL